MNAEKATCRRHGQIVTLVPVVSRSPITGLEKPGTLEVGCIGCMRELKPTTAFRPMSKP